MNGFCAATGIACGSVMRTRDDKNYFFELAVAAAISLFGFQSGAALATVVGVLVEVPVMLLVVQIANATQHWYQSGKKTRQLHRVARFEYAVKPTGCYCIPDSGGFRDTTPNSG